MKRNLVLWLALLLSRFFAVLQLAVIAALTAVLVHWHFDRNAYADVYYGDSLYYNFKFKTGVGSDAEKLISFDLGQNSSSDSDIKLSQIRPFSLYLIYLKACAICWFTLLAALEFIKVLKSVEQLQAFQLRNVEAFRKIGKYTSFVFILSSVSLVVAQQSFKFGLAFQQTPLLVMLAAFILAEIFREGNRLHQEEQLTV